jgi:hypothetical protein
MVFTNIADNGCLIGQRFRHIQLALLIDAEGIDFTFCTYQYFFAFNIEARVGAVGEVPTQVKDSELLFVWLAVPRTELGTVATLVTVSVNMQCLELVFETRDRQ